MNDSILKKLVKLKKNFNGKKIAIIGDLMLDSYYWGIVSRISPEAPVPIIELQDEFFRFGGAMNVAHNIKTLGGIPLPFGVIGNDLNGKTLKRLMKVSQISDEKIIIEKGRPTTAKTRVIANNQHIVRIDKEKTSPISSKTEKQFLQSLKKEINQLDAIILQDYNKGVLNDSFIKEIISLAVEANKIITADPKFSNFFSYHNVSVFKPNRKETEDALNMKIESSEEITQAGQILLDRLKCKHVLLTLGEDGIALFEKGKPERRVPTKARKVADVSGAGDTVISTLTMALVAGADIFDATYLANYAGGLVCQEVGIVPIELDKLFNAVTAELK